MRRLSHRSARGRRRAAPCGPAHRAGPRDRWPRRSDRAGGHRAQAWRARGRAMARLDLRHLPLLPFGAGKSVRPCGLHRPYQRRRLCHAHPRRSGILLPAAAKARCRGSGAAAVRRPHRLALLSLGRDGAGARPLRLRRRRPYPGAGRRLARPARVYAFTRRGTRRRSVSRPRSARSGPGVPRSGRRSRSTRRSSSRRSARSFRWRSAR